MSGWDFNLFNSFMEEHSEDVMLETAVACTCRNSDAIASMAVTGGQVASSRKTLCNRCRDGHGFLYRDARIVSGIVTGLSPTKAVSLAEPGYSMPGDLSFSPPPGLNVGINDRLTLLYPLDVSDGQVIVRGAANLEDNQFTQDMPENEDRLWYEAVCATWCEDEYGTLYTQDVDFEFHGRRIRWIGASPAIGSTYTVKYTAYVEWIARLGGKVRFEKGISLGDQVSFRQKHVVFLDEDSELTVCAKPSVVF